MDLEDEVDLGVGDSRLFADRWMENWIGSLLLANEVGWWQLLGIEKVRPIKIG